MEVANLDPFVWLVVGAMGLFAIVLGGVSFFTGGDAR
jgi:hypothetical protein